MRAILVDTGPLVGLIDPDDQAHSRVLETFDQIDDPLFTVWPVLVEAMYMLGYSWRAQQALWGILESGMIQLLPLTADDFPRLKLLMEKYKDLPMDLADAALVRVAEREGIRRIFTLDQRDFQIYRLSRKGTFTLLPRPE